MSTSGSWTWKRPGRNWDLLSVARFNQLNVPGLQRFHTWQVESGYTRLLNLQTALVVSYAHTSNSSQFTGVVYGLSQHGARLSFVWGPESLGLR